VPVPGGPRKPSFHFELFEGAGQVRLCSSPGRGAAEHEASHESAGLLSLGASTRRASLPMLRQLTIADQRTDVTDLVAAARAPVRPTQRGSFQAREHQACVIQDCGVVRACPAGRRQPFADLHLSADPHHGTWSWLLLSPSCQQSPFAPGMQAGPERERARTAHGCVPDTSNSRSSPVRTAHSPVRRPCCHRIGRCTRVDPLY